MDNSGFMKRNTLEQNSSNGIKAADKVASRLTKVST